MAFPFQWTFAQSQIAKSFGLMWYGHPPSDRCLIDVDTRVLAVWEGPCNLGTHFNKRNIFQRIWFPIIKNDFYDRIIFIMGILIPRKMVFILIQSPEDGTNNRTPLILGVLLYFFVFFLQLFAGSQATILGQNCVPFSLRPFMMIFYIIAKMLPAFVPPKGGTKRRQHRRNTTENQHQATVLSAHYLRHIWKHNFLEELTTETPFHKPTVCRNIGFLFWLLNSMWISQRQHTLPCLTKERMCERTENAAHITFMPSSTPVKYLLP